MSYKVILTKVIIKNKVRNRLSNWNGSDPDQIIKAVEMGKEQEILSDDLETCKDCKKDMEADSACITRIDG